MRLWQGVLPDKKSHSFISVRTLLKLELFCLPADKKSWYLHLPVILFLVQEKHLEMTLALSLCYEGQETSCQACNWDGYTTECWYWLWLAAKGNHHRIWYVELCRKMSFLSLDQTVMIVDDSPLLSTIILTIMFAIKRSMIVDDSLSKSHNALGHFIFCFSRSQLHYHSVQTCFHVFFLVFDTFTLSPASGRDIFSAFSTLFLIFFFPLTFSF